ncbi:ribonuclease III [Polyplosphaeria fusca]|uniref:Ribonuclease III n=1 Tax=Polyplosphaeria fusca TaxID=682080 RepID=A0A9P4UXV2_9PLEO|nr:ribonuclease III [Polyplosphaeria fusca]
MPFIHPQTPEDLLPELEKILQYTFKDKTIALEALQMRGGDPKNGGATPLCYAGEMFSVPKNNRLAIVGDALLNYILSVPWYESGTPAGNWTRLQYRNITNDVLGEKGLGLGLDKFVIKDYTNPKVSKGMVATLVEALVGAVSRDGGLEEAVRVTKALGLLKEK